MNSKVSYAVAAILSGVSLSALGAQPAPERSAADAAAPAPQALPAPAKRGRRASSSAGTSYRALSEIVVTATRRRENIQNVPVTMQALTGHMLQQLHISSFQDYVRMLPNLTSADNGPGQNEIFIRGIGAGSQATQFSGGTALWPNVAIYLNNQAIQLPNQNMDLYAVDLNRIEVLEGPQGTLFGSGAEAGAIRYITNDPKLDVVEGNVTGDYGVTAHGDPNAAVSGVLNLPIIRHHMAMRFVVYNDRRGGYINNAFGTFTRHDSDLGIHYANYFVPLGSQCPDGGQPNSFRAPAGVGACVPPGSPVADNVNLAKRNFNPVTYQGERVEALYKFNDDWSFLVTQLHQDLDAEGVFYQYPNAPDGGKLPPLSVVTFVPSYHRDKDSNVAWTLKGKAGPLSLLYTGGLLTRQLETQTDYTNYARGVYGDYYECFGPGSGYINSLKSTCFSAPAGTHSAQQNRVQQNEFRVTTPRSWRLRGLMGVYEEDNVLLDQTSDLYVTIPACTSNGAPGTPGNTGCFTTLGTIPGTTVKYPGKYPLHTSFGTDDRRELKQIAEYASVSFDVTPHLTVTGGARHFLFQNSFVGSVESSFGCFQGGNPPGGCYNNPDFQFNLDAQHLRDTEQGWRAQANVSWRMDPTLFGNRQHIMTYFTFSQGFRPGMFNQNGGALYGPGPDGVPQFAIPRAIHSDTLNNYEVGWKSDWRLFNRHFQWNTAFYREYWDNVQIQFFDPGFTGTLFFNDNGQNFRINGVETSFIAQIWRGLTLRGTGAWNSSEQVNSPQIIDNNPASANFGKPITELCDYSGANCSPFVDPFGPKGAPTSDSPPIRYSLLLSYDFPLDTAGSLGYLNGAVVHMQVGMQHQGHSFTQAGANPPFVPGVTISTSRLRFEDPAYTIYNASVGVSKDDWTFTFYGENLADSKAVVFTTTDNFIEAQTPLRPRVLGARFQYRF